MKPVIAIVGRPNVGKSTLFNRIIGSRKALTLDTPGSTRDRNVALAEWQGREFYCVDTGGFPTKQGGGGGTPPLYDQVEAQISIAIQECDAIVCLFDGKAGMLPEEEEIVRRLRRVEKPVYYAVNKIDLPEHEKQLHDFYQLGVATLFPVSAEHGYQVAELLDRVIADFPAEQDEHVVSGDEIRISVVGRPNVGKSSLVNALLGQERVVVDSEPGTTRDSIDTPFHFESHPYVLVDTAGIRRRYQKGGHLERLTLLKSTRAIDRADICLLVLSADEGLMKQDAHIAGMVVERGRGLILVWNKMDLVDVSDARALAENVRQALAFLPDVPIQFISAKRGSGIDKLLPTGYSVHEELGSQVSTSRLNEVFSHLSEHHSMPLYKGREVKLYYATQVGTYPPTFIVFSNIPQGVPDSYRRYLMHGLQNQLGMKRVPIRLLLKGKK